MTTIQPPNHSIFFFTAVARTALSSSSFPPATTETIGSSERGFGLDGLPRRFVRAGPRR